jgi:hypothetical protein
MNIVTRLLVREELDALELEQVIAKRSPSPDFARIQILEQEIQRLEGRLAAARRVEIARKLAG